MKTDLNYADAEQEAHRLNRLYANDYANYRRALKRHRDPVRIEKARQKIEAANKVVTDKDRKNIVLDELENLATYKYLSKSMLKEVVMQKYCVKSAVNHALKDLLAEEKAAEKQKAQSMPALTQEQLQYHLYYDLQAGTFEWQTGSRAGREAGCVVHPPVKPPKNPDPNNKDKSKLPKKKPVVYGGYHRVGEEAYLYSLDKNTNAETDIYKRYYAKLAPKGSSDLWVREPYYLKRNNPRVVIRLFGKAYSMQQLAYLYMGAGGDWDYSNGLDNIKRIPEHITVAPYGLKYYCPKTNKSKHIPCRDGDPLNFKWDNISPPVISLAEVTADPILKERVPARIRKRVYSYENNVKLERGFYTVVGIGSIGFYSWTKKEAYAELDARIQRLAGTKQGLVNGGVMVTSKVKRG